MEWSLHRNYQKTIKEACEELAQITKHHANNHVIMVEYVHHAGKASFGNINIFDIEDHILRINKKYKFAFETGGHLSREPNAVLVAYIP